MLKLAKYLIPCLLGLSIGWTPADVASQTTDPSAMALRAAILSDSWPIKKVVTNSSGDLVFAGGEFLNGADGLVFISADKFVRLAATGDTVPGRTGFRLAAVGIKGIRFSSHYGDFSLNTRRELAFSANVVSCSSSSDVAQCANSSPQLEGLFLFSEDSKSAIALQGDSAPETSGGVFRSFERVLSNDRGSIVFSALVTRADGTLAGGLFSYSGNRISKIVMSGDATPIGEISVLVQSSLFFHLNGDGAVTFSGYLAREAKDAVFRYENGVLSKLAAQGDPAPDGGTIGRILEVDANNRGDVVFRSTSAFTPGAKEGLYLRDRGGSSSKIVEHGDNTPIGGQYVLLGMASLRTVPITIAPKVNDSGDVLFLSPVERGQTNTGLFLVTREGIKKIAADGDPIPGQPNLSVKFEKSGSKFSLNNLGQAVFSSSIAGRSGVSSLFSYGKGKLFKILVPGDVAPGTDGEFFGSLGSFDLKASALSDSGDVAFQSPVCCGKYKEGVFVAGFPRASIAGGDFEVLGDGGLPENWQITWNNSGSGEVFQYDSAGADAFEGRSVLRLHVNRGGGATFVVSNPISVAADAVYIISSRMRYYLSSSSDAVHFSIIQFDSAGNQIGFDEITGLRGDNFWTWVSKSLLIRTLPSVASIRIRFGLITSTESYLDIDAVR